MKAFAELYATLDETTRTHAKVAALARYFASAPPADAAWAVYFLTGGRPKRLVASRRLREWAAAAAGIPDWLFEESYETVGDLAETIALLLPPGEGDGGDEPLHRWVEERLLPLAGADDAERRRALLAAWAELDEGQRFVYNKLLTGGFRVGVSRQLVTRALSEVSGIDAATLAHRLMGTWRPTPEAFTGLLAADTRDADASRPYPFLLAHPLEATTAAEVAAALGPVDDWQAEWKWDGIRAQLVRRGGRAYLWSRGEELIGERFPEIVEEAALLPDGTVLDGELLAIAPGRGDDGRPLPFAQLQRRIGRKRLGPRILAEVPVALVAYDGLEMAGEDLRGRPLAKRRAVLEELLSGLRGATRLRLSEIVTAATWKELTAARKGARARGAEGLMLKRRTSAYGVGRKRGDWWKWKVAPFTVDAVLLYAQRGHGRRASLYTDYTFGLWQGEELVPFAKAYSGLTDAEIREVDRFVRGNTVERFGPVRSVKPELVFELAFEGIQASRRHKSGLAVRFPRMLRLRRDKPAAEADRLAAVRALLDT